MLSFSFAPERNGANGLETGAGVGGAKEVVVGLIFLVLVAMGPLLPNPTILLAGVAANETVANGFTADEVVGFGVLTLEANDVFANGFELAPALGVAAAALKGLMGAFAGVGSSGIAAEGVLMPAPFFQFLQGCKLQVAKERLLREGIP
jgi:hypothetical protein